MKNYKVGQTLYYVVCDFDSAEIIKGVIETVEDDHIILAKDGMHIPQKQSTRSA